MQKERRVSLILASRRGLVALLTWAGVIATGSVFEAILFRLGLGAYDNVIDHFAVSAMAAVTVYLSLGFVRKSQDYAAESRRARLDWELTFDAVPDLIAIIDTQHRIVRANKAMASRLGLPKERCIGLKCHATIHGLDEPLMGCPHGQSLLDGCEHAAELHEDRLGGDFLITTSPLHDRDGKLVGCVHVARDITERKRVEDELRWREAELKAAQRIAHVGSWKRSLDGGSATWSEELNHIAGRDPASPAPGFEELLQILTPDSGARYRAAIEKCKAGAAQEVDLQLMRPDGSMRWVTTRVELQSNARGQDVQLQGTVQDITERKRQEEALRAGEERFRALFECSRDAVQMLNCRGEFLDCNRATLELLRLESKEQFLARHPEENSPPTQPDGRASRELAREKIEAAFREGSQFFEWRVQRADGTEFTAELLLSRGELKGEPILQCVMRDITERKRAEEELRSKTAFLEAISNSTIDGILVFDDQRRKILHNQQYTDLYKIPQDLVESKDYRPLVESSASKVKNPEEFRQRVAYLFDHPDEIGRDEIELIDGAIIDRYSAPVIGKDGTRYGRIWTFRDITKRKQAEEQLRSKTAFLEAISNSSIDGVLVVNDEDQKILQNQQLMKILKVPQHILDTSDDMIMRQDVAARTRNPEEFLAKIAYLHDHPVETTRDELEFKDGTILDRYSAPVIGDDGKYYGRVWTFRDITERKRAEDELRSKTAFLEAQVNSTIDGILVVDGHGRRVLQNQRFTEMFCIPQDLAENQEDFHPQLQSFTTKVKNPEEFLEKIAYLYDHPDETCRDELEFSDGSIIDRYSAPVIGKDGRRYGRIWTFRDITERKRSEPETMPRILVVEDNPTNRQVALAMLAKLGYQADAANNGADALNALRDADYDVVLMDCEMPVMDGYEATRRIRSQEGVRNPGVPILALTADAMSEARERCLAAGMDDYLSKPLEAHDLDEALKKWLPAALPAPPPTAPQLERVKAIFDEEDLLKRLMADKPLATKIVAGFLQEVPAKLCSLRKLQEKRDAGGIHLEAHALKGAAATISAVALRGVASEIQDAATAHDLEATALLLPRVQDEIERLKAVLEQSGWIEPATHQG